MAVSSAVDASAIARVVGIRTEFRDLRDGNVVFLPQRLAVIGQGSAAATYTTTKRQVTSSAQVAELYGSGSPLHLAALQLFPRNGDGVGTIPVTVYPLTAGTGAVAATGRITPTGTITRTSSFRLRVNNIVTAPIVVSLGQTVPTIVSAMVEAINGNLDMPITAAGAAAIANDPFEYLTLTAKWQGVSSNDIVVEVLGPTDVGLTFAIMAFTGGLVNPSVDSALAQFGNVWETLVLNCLDISDSTALSAYATFGEGRWGSLVRRPLVVFTGNTSADVADAIQQSDNRKTDRVNAQLVSPGSNDLPFVVAARQLARIARVANNDPARDYGSQKATGLTPGEDAVQWTYNQRDQAVKGGSSTIEVQDGVINIGDVVTFYHPDGDPIPAYRYVVDIVKVQNIIFNLDLIFSTPAWDGAPLIPDDQPTVNPNARRPKTAVAAVSALLDDLGLQAIISDPETAKLNTRAAINSMNPKRLDVSTTVQLSGNTNILSIDFNFGFSLEAQKL